MYRVTIENLEPISEDTDGFVSVVFFNSDLGGAIAAALLGTRAPRVSCQELARIVYSVLVGEPDIDEQDDFFPGYSAALKTMLEAAETIVDGWENHDKQFKP